MNIQRSRISKTEAIVLKKQELLEKDIRLTLFTSELGRLHVIGKGIRSLTSRRASHIQTGNLVNVQLYKRHEVYYLQDTEIISGFSELKGNPLKMDLLYRFLFILDRMLPEQQSELAVYSIAKRFLISISRKGEFTKSDLAGYMKDVMKTLGFGSNATTFPELMSEIEEIIQEKMPTNVII